MSFNVLFRGLVCHLTEEKVAVFVDAENHKLRLVVRASDVVGKPSFQSDDVHTKDDKEDDDDNAPAPPPRVSFLVGGGMLHIDGVTNKKLLRGDDFKKRVPSLREGSTCTKLRKEVRQRRMASGIAGYFQYPGGKMSVQSYFPEQAVFTGTVPQCIARVTRLELAVNGKNVTIRNGSQKVTLKPDAEVSFVNVDDTAMDDTAKVPVPNLHFHHYYHAIYDGCGMGKTPRPPAKRKPCPSEQADHAFPGSDCSNSQEP